MQPLRPAAGYTTIEALIAVVVLAILLAVGLPNLSGWLSSTKVAGAVQFYAEGYAMARSQALANNAASRLVFSRNAVSGQPDWQVDVCFPAAGQPCDADSERWSTLEDEAATDGTVGVAVRSVRRSAEALPASSLMSVELPAGASAVYFTPLGWVDSGPATPADRIDLSPASGHEDAFAPASLVLTMAGVATRCNPDADDGDSRRCPE
ncbi:hypothetical protein B0920_03910 [Massilia sp. KIM]|uniref:pilus assembly FimT family protein n=1 Tax=Massilia sp. KIM TaxID=1955422 RepID=UPI00098E8B94|nr:hypothetical protein [Massilia sp. KIM]OON62599.1 hypothetical protein B0920_03910 [Massilia sp. KIM]